MICHQPVYRALQDTPHDKALLTCSFTQLIFIMPGNAAHKTYRQVTAIILHHIATEEVTEIVDHQLPNLRNIYVATDEGRQRCQETIGHRFTVYTGYNSRHIHTYILLKPSN